MTGRLCAAVAACAVAAFAANAADLYYWGKVDGSASGSFDDGSHWHSNTTSGATGTVPGNGARAMLQTDSSYTLSFPAGVYTNYARFMAYNYQGKTVNYDGRGSVFLHPENADGTYELETFHLFRHNTVQDILGFSVRNAAPDPSTSANLALSNFYFTVTHPTSRTFNAVFSQGHYNFLNPCGKVWNYSTVAPCLYFFNLNNNNASATADLLDSMDVSFENGTTLLAPVVALQGNAYTNTLTLHGGSHQFSLLCMPARINGQAYAERRTITDFVLDDGASLELTSSLWLCNNSQASQRVERITVKNGSHMRFPAVSMACGTAEITLDNGSATIGNNGNGSQNLDGSGTLGINFAATNKSVVVFDHKGSAAGANGHGFYFGISGASAASTVCRHFFVADDSDVTVKSGAKAQFYGADVKFRNGTRLQNNGTLKFIGNSGGMPLTVAFDGVAFTNASAVPFASTGPVGVVLTNGTTIVTSKTLAFGGEDQNPVAGEHVNATVDIYGGSVKSTASDAYFYLGYAARASAVMNLHSGSIEGSADNNALVVGSGGDAEFNNYGGTVDVFGASVGSTSRADYTNTAESVYRQLGGSTRIRCVNNGEFVGFGIANGVRRKARLVLDGGVLSSFTTYGGGGAKCRGGSGKASFEADGGTLRAPCATPCLLHDFDEAELGAKGLTIDSAGYAVTVAQSFTSKAGAAGRLVLAGEGAKTMTGDLSGVSNVVVECGAVSFAPATALGALVVSNGVSMTLDPAATQVVRSLALGGSPRIALSSAVTIGESYDLVRVSEAPDAATVAAWQSAYVAAGLPADTAVDLSCVEDNGEYVLRLAARYAMVISISLDEGTHDHVEDIAYAPQDTLRATVAAGADLTLSGQLGVGTLEKLGDGKLRLTNAGNLFMPGILLYAGCVSLADPAVLGTGDMAGGVRAKNGVLEVTGPAGGAEIDSGISLVQESTNDIFVIKNDVDLTMPCPVGTGTTGELIKRGPGTLTLTVEGTKTLTGGLGYGRLGNGSLVWAMTSISQLTFDETSGMVTTNGITPLMVVEGELRFKGIGDGATVNLGGITVVGTSTKVGTVQPGLVLDNVSFVHTLANQKWTEVGLGINNSSGATARSGDFTTAPYVALTNNARYATGNFELGRLSAGEGLKCSLDVDGSVLDCSGYFSVNRAHGASVETSTEFRNDSRLYANSIYLFRESTLVFDSSILAKNASLAQTAIVPEVSDMIAATFLFRNGSKAYVGRVDTASLNVAKYHPLYMVFDDSEWIPASGDYVFEWSDPSKMSIVATNGNLRLPVPDGATWTMNQPVTGNGGLANTGAGTLVIGEGAAQYKGPTVAGEGATVDFGGHPANVRMAGAGTFANGTVTGGIALELDASGASVEVPTIASDLALSGTIRVSAGRTSETPLQEPYAAFDVLKYDGDAPDVGSFRLRDTGVRNLGGEFAVDAVRKVVVCTPSMLGGVILVR